MVVDLLGLGFDAMLMYGDTYQSSVPKNQPEYPKEMRKCCPDDKIKEGEKILNDRFKDSVAEAKRIGLVPAPIGEYGATCATSSTDILRRLAPYPQCWSCYAEYREKHYTIGLAVIYAVQHQAIICRAFGKDSNMKKEIIYDWWHDTKYNDQQSGGSPDQFRKDWPFEAAVIHDVLNKVMIDCNGALTVPEYEPVINFPASTQAVPFQVKPLMGNYGIRSGLGW